ncbi:MAG TPA: FAD-binding oxidoreductase [Ktedonobacteraceae bacterium]|nr:FAD-binding oxidoreductase [Ktedonobacteraceae bacterium]
MPATRTEIAIIGGGVIGNSIAYHLARQGQHVLVIERSDIASEPAASWASAGGVRRQGRHPAEARLASEAIQRWHTLSEELEADLHYRQGGQLWLAESDSEAEQVAAYVQQQHTMGFSDVRLVNRAEALQLVPGLNAQVVAGSYSPSDGQASPPHTTRAFAQAAQRLGATYQTNAAALSLITHADRVTGARTAQGDVEAQHTVLAAGAWSDELALTAGLRLPIRAVALQMLLSTPAQPNLLQPVIGGVSRKLSLKQLVDGSFFIGGGWLGNVSSDRRSYTMRAASIQGNWSTACELLPAVAQQRIARSWCGLEAQSIDDIPFIGSAPGLDGLILALGFSGHGFAISPAVGRAVADQLAGRPTPELDSLSPARLASFDPARIAAFLT